MSQARVLGMIGIAALAAAAVAYAQTTVTPIPESEPVEAAPLNAAPEQVTWGDADAGATKAGTCAACHGVDGNPSDPQYPRLAGQNERYLAHQIALFKSGERNTGMAAVMKPFADALSAQDARDIGAYYATQKAGAGVADDSVVASGPNEGMKFYEVGEKLFHGGDPARGIPACMACHGPDGAGNPGPAYPQVAGQQAAYTQRRLEEYRAGVTQERDPHLFNVMATVANALTDEEIGALSSYMQGLHPRADDYVAADAPATALPAAPSTEAPAATEPAPADDAQPETEAGDAAEA
ncbi:c-type cytochrome [Marilutibacter maris]|uniref:C-type cytochrome n=1 Tax=Marilutibacter maris TaxID=1605891 RepID=A0A2U9TL72_9GAMM|nr:c-type cytochrome [Lysobacter maris]AWV08680.1 cytochrome C [Lysobacter maris]KAB8164890.1 c-type cytochrome [Lysobacter maris]